MSAHSHSAFRFFNGELLLLRSHICLLLGASKLSCGGRRSDILDDEHAVASFIFCANSQGRLARQSAFSMTWAGSDGVGTCAWKEAALRLSDVGWYVAETDDPGEDGNDSRAVVISVICEFSKAGTVPTGMPALFTRATMLVRSSAVTPSTGMACRMSSIVGWPRRQPACTRRSNAVLKIIEVTASN